MSVKHPHLVVIGVAIDREIERLPDKVRLPITVQVIDRIIHVIDPKLGRLEVTGSVAVENLVKGAALVAVHAEDVGFAVAIKIAHQEVAPGTHRCSGAGRKGAIPVAEPDP